MPEHPALEAQSVSTYSIKVDDSEIPTHYGITLIEVSLRLNGIPSAVLHIDDGSMSEETFPISESPDFVPGGSIEIALGYDSKATKVFEGIIVSQGLRVRGDERSVLVVSCLAEAAKLTVQRKCTYFLKQKDSDIIRKVIEDGGATAGSIDSTPFQHPEVIQYQCTDWDFIMTRAELNSMVVHVEGKEVHVVKPQVKGSAALVLTYGSDILRSDLDLDARDQVDEVICKAWNPKEGKLVEGKSSEPDVNAQGDLDGKNLAKVLASSAYELHTTTATDKGMLQNWAEARLLRTRLARIRGSLSFYGNPKAVPNSLIKLEGLGARFNGDGYISAVIHRMEEGVWTTEATLGLPAEWFVETKPNIEVPPAAGMLPGVKGLYTATVKQIHEDPDNGLRVQVVIPVMDQKNEGVWARLGQGYASDKHGIFFFPEVGDEVIVGFLQDDPRFPIILGSVYSAKRPGAYTPDDKNTFKAITTKSLMKIEFNDDDKVLTILTPKGKELIISDKDDSITMKDNHSNQIVMDSAGILLKTPKDFVVKADGNIAFDTKGNCETKATGDFKAEGMNVEVKGQTKFAAQGTMAEVKASSQLTLKGAMVMIN